MLKFNSKIKEHKKSQNLLYSYMFYILLSLIVLSSVYFFANTLNSEVRDLKNNKEFEQNSNLYIQNFLRSLQLPDSKIMFNTTQTFSNSQALLRANSYYSSFETRDFAYFYKHQVEFCDNYSMSLENVEFALYNSSLNCIYIDKKVSLFE